MTECSNCLTENETYREKCKKCGVDLQEEIPKIVLLNQPTGTRSMVPLNLPLITLAGRLLGQFITRRGVFIFVICVLIILLLLSILGNP